MPLGEAQYPRDEVSPGAYRALLSGAVILLDEYLDSVQHIRKNADVADSTIGADLPPAFAPRYTVGFCYRFVACAFTVAWKLRAPGAHRLACVAEELALRALIHRAEAWLAMEDLDEDLEPFRTIAFEDWDFERLYATEPIDLEGTPQQDLLNLRFRDWFKPFDKDNPVHPYVEDAPEASG